MNKITAVLMTLREINGRYGIPVETLDRLEEEFREMKQRKERPAQRAPWLQRAGPGGGHRAGDRGAGGIGVCGE